MTWEIRVSLLELEIEVYHRALGGARRRPRDGRARALGRRLPDSASPHPGALPPRASPGLNRPSRGRGDGARPSRPRAARRSRRRPAGRHPHTARLRRGYARRGASRRGVPASATVWTSCSASTASTRRRPGTLGRWRVALSNASASWIPRRSCARRWSIPRVRRASPTTHSIRRRRLRVVSRGAIEDRRRRNGGGVRRRRRRIGSQLK